MAERWRYAQGNHPAYCTCVRCNRTGGTTHPNRPPRHHPPGAFTEVFEHQRAEEHRRREIRERLMREKRIRRIRSILWTLTTFALISLIVTYLVLTVSSPSAVETLMASWAQLFDDVLAR